MEKVQEKDNCFPFESIGDYSTNLNMELKEDKIDNKPNLIINMKFKTKKYYIDETGKKRRVKKRRKYKTDDIRKKVKVQFHKALKNLINHNLKKAGSKKFFKFFPQKFIENTNRKFNNKYLDYTYKELLLTDFSSFLNDYRNKAIDFRNYLANKETIEYLEQNEAISNNSGFDVIKKLKYKDLLKAYFTSKQFEDSIHELKDKKETINYIIDYIRISKSYVNFFSLSKSHKKEAKKVDVTDLNEEFGNYYLFEDNDNFDFKFEYDEYSNIFNKFGEQYN